MIVSRCSGFASLSRIKSESRGDEKTGVVIVLHWIFIRRRSPLSASHSRRFFPERMNGLSAHSTSASSASMVPSLI